MQLKERRNGKVCNVAIVVAGGVRRVRVLSDRQRVDSGSAGDENVGERKEGVLAIG